MPALLVEMGFISNPEQEKQLLTDTFQGSIVQALVDGVVRYRDARGERTAPAAVPGKGPGAPR
jgi:N-acetylmuramoyl-L-alanine amidase